MIMMGSDRPDEFVNVSRRPPIHSRPQRTKAEVQGERCDAGILDSRWRGDDDWIAEIHRIIFGRAL